MIILLIFIRNIYKIVSYKNNIDNNNILFYIDKLKTDNEPVFLKDLNINGNDLNVIGFKNIQTGECLKYLLYKLHFDKNINNKNDLKKLAKERYDELY